MSEVKLHVGDIDDMGKRFIDAWKRLENGQQVEERHLSFFSLDAMMATLSQKRLEILKHLHRHQEKMWLLWLAYLIVITKEYTLMWKRLLLLD